MDASAEKRKMDARVFAREKKASRFEEKTEKQNEISVYII